MPKNKRSQKSFLLGPMPAHLNIQLSAELERLGYCKGDGGVVVAYIASLEEADNLATQMHQHLVAVVSDPGLASAAAEAGARGIIELPMRRPNLKIQLDLAEAAASHEALLREQYERLERTLKQRHIIEAAVHKLVRHQDFTPDQAYASLREQAMKQRVSIEKLATMIAGN